MSRRRPLVAATVVLLCAVSAGGGYSLASRQTDRTPAASGPTALVLVRSEGARLVPLGTPPTPETDRSYRRLQMALVRSPDTLNRALAEPATRAAMADVPEPIDWLATRLTTEFDEGGEILRVGLTGLPRREAAVVVNAVVRHYVDHANAMARRSMMERAERLERLRADIRNRLEMDRSQLARRAELGSAPDEEVRIQENLTELYRERTALRVGAANAAGDPAREKAFAAAEGAKGKAIREGAKVLALARMNQARQPPSEVAALEAAEASLGAELLRLTIERGAEARVTVLQPADPGPKQD